MGMAASAQHRGGGHPRKQHHHVKSLGKSLTSVQQCVHPPPHPKGLLDCDGELGHVHSHMKLFAR